MKMSPPQTAQYLRCCLLCFSIHVHSSVDTAVETLQTLVTPDGCPVLCLRHSPSFLFAGLASGKVAVFQRGAGGELPAGPG